MSPGHLYHLACRIYFRTRRCLLLGLILLMNVNCNQSPSPVCSDLDFAWNLLPAIPDSTGFAGSFAGTSNGALLVAGGANFPNGGTPWNGGIKKWYDIVFVLESPDTEWKKAGSLPLPLGYGVSITTGDGILLIGGSNENGHEAGVWRLRYQDHQLKTDTLPSLPFPLANASGAQVGSHVYVAGGLISPDSLHTHPVFLSLNLKAVDRGWQKLPVWPGPSRMLAVAGSDNNRFYLFSGTRLVDGKREYLRDAYAYSADSGWQVLPDLPQPVVAAPSPAWLDSDGNFFLFGGDDGELAPQSAELKEKHPGFNNGILRFHTDSGLWHQTGKIFTKKEPDAVAFPNNSIWAPVTTPLVEWKGKLVFPGGEVRPATRSSNVLLATPCTRS